MNQKQFTFLLIIVLLIFSGCINYRTTTYSVNDPNIITETRYSSFMKDITIKKDGLEVTSVSNKTKGITPYGGWETHK